MVRDSVIFTLPEMRSFVYLLKMQLITLFCLHILASFLISSKRVVLARLVLAKSECENLLSALELVLLTHFARTHRIVNNHRFSLMLCFKVLISQPWFQISQASINCLHLKLIINVHTRQRTGRNHVFHFLIGNLSISS